MIYLFIHSDFEQWSSLRHKEQEVLFSVNIQYLSWNRKFLLEVQMYRFVGCFRLTVYC